MYAMMQCKTKSENLTHILGYQFWAVTPIRPSIHEFPGLINNRPKRTCRRMSNSGGHAQISNLEDLIRNTQPVHDITSNLIITSETEEDLGFIQFNLLPRPLAIYTQGFLQSLYTFDITSYKEHAIIYK